MVLFLPAVFAEDARSSYFATLSCNSYPHLLHLAAKLSGSFASNYNPKCFKSNTIRSYLSDEESLRFSLVVLSYMSPTFQ